MIAPSTFLSGTAFPVVVEATLQNEIDLFRSEELTVSISGGVVSSENLQLKKGRSMTTLETNVAAHALTIFGQGLNISVNENASPEMVHSGAIVGTQTWHMGTIHRISSDIHISANDSLVIEQGCWVVLDSAVNIIVEGVLEARGIRTSPITFCAGSSESWGGIVSSQGVVNLKYVLLNNGGGDYTKTYGHSGSQPVLKTESGHVEATQTFIFDCEGKGLGGDDGNMIFRNGGISRCDTGGEFGGTTVLVSNTHIMDIPDDDGILDDDDNDGLYFSGFTSQPSVVDSCVFINGEDDAIDHNNAVLEVRNTWVENFANEGIAASNGNSVHVYNSLFKNCEQGIEAGYGSPQVTVNHCVMVDNDNGLRFGDWYNWGCSGSITCTNSIMYANLDNVYNHDVLSNGPVANAIDLTFGIANDTEYDGNTGCLSGVPNFTNQYQLEPTSIGTGAANDGLNMGLISPVATGMSNLEYEDDLPIQSVRVFDLNGKLIMVKKNSQLLDWNILPSGIYIVEKNYGAYTKRVKKAVVR